MCCPITCAQCTHLVASKKTPLIIKDKNPSFLGSLFLKSKGLFIFLSGVHNIKTSVHWQIVKIT